jgi:hypothetical protein
MCSLMEIQSTRQPYEAPAVEIVPVRSEGIVCASGGPYPGWPGENI